MKNKVKSNTRNLFGMLRVVRQLVPELFTLILAICLLEAALPYINILSMQLIIDGFTAQVPVSKLLLVISVTIMANAAVRLLTGLLAKYREQAQVKLELTFQKTLCFHEMELPLSHIESTRVKELQRDIEQAKMRNGGIESVVKDFEIIIRNIMILVISFLMLFRIFFIQEITEVSSFWTSPFPVMLLSVFVVAITAATFRLQSRQSIKIAKLNEEANHANGSAFAYMQFISDYHFGKDIRIYKLGSFLCNYFDNLWKSSIGYRLTQKLGKESAKIPCITAVGNGILNIFIYTLAIGKACAREISIGNIIVYIGSIQSFLQAIVGLIGSVGEMLGHGALMKPYLELLELEEEMQYHTGDEVLRDIKEIAFQHVYFRYPGKKCWVLEDVSFTLKAGEKAALVGENGSGKSTIIKLICRFYEPEQGKIRVNGIDIQKYSHAEYRKLIGIVFQDFSLPALQLGKSIACGESYDGNKLKRILYEAGLKGWIEAREVSMEDCLFKDYSGDGLEVSGGEGQKIAIARAIYKDAPLIVLDEPTAALDPRAEADIFQSFDRLTQNKTCIIISHRLSSCKFCHRILVLHEGRLIQSGSHEKLLEKGGKYKELWDAQAGLYDNFKK